MNNTTLVDIFDCTKDGAYELSSVTALLNEILNTFGQDLVTHASVYCPLAHMLSKSSPPVQRSKQRYRL